MIKTFLTLSLVGYSALSFADSGIAGTPGIVSNVLLLGGFLFIFYFLLIRPQAKRAKEQQTMLNSISVDDEVIVNGVVGKVTKITEQFLTLQIAQNVDIKVQKQAVSASLPKGTMNSI